MIFHYCAMWQRDGSTVYNSGTISIFIDFSRDGAYLNLLDRIKNNLGISNDIILISLTRISG